MSEWVGRQAGRQAGTAPVEWGLHYLWVPPLFVARRPAAVPLAGRQAGWCGCHGCRPTCHPAWGLCCSRQGTKGPPSALWGRHQEMNQPKATVYTPLTASHTQVITTHYLGPLNAPHGCKFQALPACIYGGVSRHKGATNSGCHHDESIYSITPVNGALHETLRVSSGNSDPTR